MMAAIPSDVVAVEAVVEAATMLVVVDIAVIADIVLIVVRISGRTVRDRTVRTLDLTTFVRTDRIM